MRYRVTDPQHVYDPVEVEVPFSALVDPLLVPTVKTLAIEKMYGCPIGDVDPVHVREMFETLEVVMVG